MGWPMATLPSRCLVRRRWDRKAIHDTDERSGIPQAVNPLYQQSAEKVAENKFERDYAARKALRRVKSPQRKRDFSS
jgi:hypothetical protein